MKHLFKKSIIFTYMKNRFPIEFFQELTRKNMLKEDGDPEITLVDDDNNTEDLQSLDLTAEDRVQTQKLF